MCSGLPQGQREATRTFRIMTYKHLGHPDVHLNDADELGDDSSNITIMVLFSEELFPTNLSFIIFISYMALFVNQGGYTNALVQENHIGLMNTRPIKTCRGNTVTDRFIGYFAVGVNQTK